MENKQELEWAEAQKIVISEDLVAAAKQQLKFLAAVDRNGHLYDGPALNRAIYRYNYCWLPLLAKYAEYDVSESPLVVPLDCEWIWHCHRLNPVCYKADCKELYGKILGNRNVVSSVQGSSTKQTEAIWKRMYPNEPYELDLSNNISEDVEEDLLAASKCTKYDLVSAVKRQSTFFFQVSRPCMNDDSFLEGAVARYKGFLHLIKRNRERGIKQFCVPTYDIDLIWHSHQLHPVSYCKDLVALLGKVLAHDDTDSDRSKGKKLDVGFSGTTKQWEETFGSRYWRAGAMYRGSAPTPLHINKCSDGKGEIKIITSLEKQGYVEVELARKGTGLISGEECKYKVGCGYECEAVEKTGACGGCGGCSGCGGGCGNENVAKNIDYGMCGQCSGCGGGGSCGGGGNCGGSCGNKSADAPI